MNEHSQNREWAVRNKLADRDHSRGDADTLLYYKGLLEAELQEVTSRLATLGVREATLPAR
jgi:hypothetical protein